MLINPLKTIVACAVLSCCAMPSTANAQFTRSVKIKFPNLSAESHPRSDDIIVKKGARIENVTGKSWVSFNNVDFGVTANSILVNTGTVHAGGTLIFSTGAPFGQSRARVIGSVRVPKGTGLDAFEARLATPVSGIVSTLYVYFSGAANKELFDLKNFQYSNSDVGRFINAARFDEESALYLKTTIHDAGNAVTNIRAKRPIEYWSFKDFQFGNGASTIVVNASSATRGGRLYIKSGDPVDGPVLGSIYIGQTGGWNNYEPFIAQLNEDLVRKHRGKDLYFVVTDEEGPRYQFNVESFRFDQSGLYVHNLLTSAF